MQDFEKLGAFYLGKEYDMQTRERTEDLLLYDSRDLCTHAVVVGMTGSGKTGLCVGMLEEAAMDRIPAIVIDPKGDISNLLLTFPNLTPEEFRPWVDESEANRKGISPAEFATNEADKWKEGLASWGQDGERIRTMRENVDMRVYTPGSTIGRPITILKSFAVPNDAVMNDPELLGDSISSAVSGLLALVGVDGDPIQSREHIFVSNVISNAWKAGRDLDLGQLIMDIQNPPFERVGIMDVDTFFPKKDRSELAMTINNLLASPSFSNWMVGEPLNIKRMLHTPEGKPCISVVSIAHLSDQERMFFVTILLNEVIAWMRTQPGTSSLRAMLYMDEVFGYFPPTKNPPSKLPMLTLLKQARAFGLGCVLATQNPVDLDYKGLSNAGTWFLGRLQTERDKARVLEGLEGASSQAGSTFDRGAMEQTLAGLGSRVFLMNNVHDDQPVVFETRWAMSYLRGPLTRSQIQTLCESDLESTTTEDRETAAAMSAPVRERPDPETLVPQVDPRQMIPADVRQIFIRPNRSPRSDERLLYRPGLLGRGRLHYIRATYKIDHWTEVTQVSRVSGGEMPNEIWDQARILERAPQTEDEPDSDAEFAKLPSDLQKEKLYKTLLKELKENFYRDHPMEVFKCKELKKYSDAGETLGDFRVRLEQLVSEKRDEEKEKLRKSYTSKFSTLRDRIRRAEDKIEVEREQYQNSRMSGYLSMGTTLLGALLGRKTISATSARRAGTSVRSMSRASKEKSDIARAEDNLEDLQVKFEDLEREFKNEVAEIEEKLSVSELDFEPLTLSPRKSDISIEEMAVCWMPTIIDADGIAEEAY